MDKNIIIERFYRDHKNHVYNFLCRITDEPELALEITQQTFVQALSDENVAQIANPKTYLFTIARNILFTEYELVTPPATDPMLSNEDTQVIDIDEIENSEPTSERLDIQAKVEKSIKRMPVETKELMILQNTEELTNKEISVITSRSVIDVKVNLHRARVQFESYLKVTDKNTTVASDQCDTLQAILTPHLNSKIPENYLQLVDQHISNCEICVNDVDKLIQSQILFNLAPLISTPSIFDKKMSDAMASKFKFLSISNRKKSKRRKKSSKFNPKNVTKNEQGKKAEGSETKDSVTETESNENNILTQETNKKAQQDTKSKEKSQKELKQDSSDNVTDISKNEIKKDSSNKISNIDTSKNETNKDSNNTISTLDNRKSTAKNESKKESNDNVTKLNSSTSESKKDSNNITKINKSTKTVTKNYSKTSKSHTTSKNIIESEAAKDTETETIDALKNAAAPNTVTGKILSAQSNMSIIFSLVVTVVVIVLFNTLSTDGDNNIVAQINLDQDENDFTVKQRFIPNSSSIVSFKALNIQTGHTISNGLNWEIYSKNDIADKSKKLNLIQKSSAAEYNIVLNYGKYLAKVRYKDKEIKSDFEIKDDNPVEIKLSFNHLNISKGKSLVDNALPTIHIRRKESNLYKSKPIKLQWNRCVRIIKRYLKARSQNSKAWREKESDIQEKIPNFRLNRGLASEPKWSKLAENIEDEYFSGNKYALYKKGSHYRITNDGSCRLIKTSYRTADIDDGKFSYHINYINKTAAKSVSQVVIEKSINAMNSRLAQDNPKSTDLITFENNALNHNSHKVFINKFSKIIRSESIAGEKCVYSSMDEQLGARSCYWKSMHEYPSLVKREIILKTSSFTKKKTNQSVFGETSKIATLFEKDIVIKDNIFSIPANMFITDNTH